jgi:hypothetical protein
MIPQKKDGFKAATSEFGLKHPVFANGFAIFSSLL